MGIDVTLLRDLCEKTLEGTDFPNLGQRIVGKVRDSYVRDSQRTIIVSDRVSAFALERAERAGISARAFPYAPYKTKESPRER